MPTFSRPPVREAIIGNSIPLKTARNLQWWRKAKGLKELRLDDSPVVGIDGLVEDRVEAVRGGRDASNPRKGCWWVVVTHCIDVPFLFLRGSKVLVRVQTPVIYLEENLLKFGGKAN